MNTVCISDHFYQNNMNISLDSPVLVEGEDAIGVYEVVCSWVSGECLTPEEEIKKQKIHIVLYTHDH